MLAPKTVLYGPQFTRQYLIKKSTHLLSPWQLNHSLCQNICVRPPLVEMLFIVFFFCLREYAVRSNCNFVYIYIYYIWRRNEAINRYIKTRIHFYLHHLNLVRKALTSCSYARKLNVSMNQTSCSCARIVHYTSCILVRIMHLKSAILHLLILKALA